jgi:hypothetical protein
MSTDVFLRVGRTYLPEQEAFVAGLEATLRGVGVNPRTVGRSDFPYVELPRPPTLCRVADAGLWC